MGSQPLADLAKYIIEYGVDDSFDYATIEIEPDTTYTVTGLQTNTTYSFNVRTRDTDGNPSMPSNYVDATTGDLAVGDKGRPAIPTDFSIASLYPNPFNPTMSVVVGLPDVAKLELAVYNVMGRKVAILSRGVVAAGFHSFTFDGSGMASGVYFVRAYVPGKLDQVRKIVLMR